MARPMLAEVLAALTDLPAEAWSAFITLDGRSVADRPLVPWAFTDPAGAQENLVVHGLLPEGWCGDVRRGWYCETCRGTGWVSRNSSTGSEFCDVCRQHSDRPRTIPDLVAVASLGVPVLLRSETLARDACAALREYGCPQPQRVVWRAGYRMLPGDFAWRMRGTYGVQRDGAASFPGFLALPVKAVAALWRMGLALDAITSDAVRIVVPPVGGVR